MAKLTETGIRCCPKRNGTKERGGGKGTAANVRGGLEVRKRLGKNSRHPQETARGYLKRYVRGEAMLFKKRRKKWASPPEKRTTRSPFKRGENEKTLSRSGSWKKSFRGGGGIKNLLAEGSTK